MHTAVREIENLLQRHQQTHQKARPAARLPSELTTRFSGWLDSRAPALIAITVTALLTLAIGLASTAFAFIPVIASADTIIAKTDPLPTLTSAEIADRGYGRLKDGFCQAAFKGLLPMIDRAEHSDFRQKAEDEPSVAAPALPSDIRSDKRRKYHGGNRIRYRTSSSLQSQTKRRPSLIERFTGVRL